MSVKSTVGMHACLVLPPPAVLDAGADANLLVEGGGSDAPRSAAALAAKAGYGRSLAVLLPRSKPSIVQDVVVRAARTAAEAGGSPASVVRHPLLAVALGCPATTPAVVQVSLLPPHRTTAEWRRASLCSLCVSLYRRGIPASARFNPPSAAPQGAASVLEAELEAARLAASAADSEARSLDSAAAWQRRGSKEHEAAVNEARAKRQEADRKAKSECGWEECARQRHTPHLPPRPTRLVSRRVSGTRHSGPPHGVHRPRRCSRWRRQWRLQQRRRRQ